MRRALILAAVGVALVGFTLTAYDSQTERTRWQVRYDGAAYNTVVPESTDLAHCFYPGDVTNTYPWSFWRTAGAQCSWGIAGSGGTNGVWINFVHEDGGVDCSCSVGDCATTAGTEMGCQCLDGGYGASGNGIELGRAIMEDGGWQFTRKECIQVSPQTDCAGNPAQFSCSIDLFR